MKEISVLTINYNTADLIQRCIESVLRQQDVNYEMLVVDNASTDNSVAVLQDYYDRVILLPNKKNLGFGRANNQAFRKSSGRYLLLLNPDAMLLTPHDLANLIRYMDEHPDYGLIGTRIVDSHQNPIVTVSDHYPRQKQTTINFSCLPGEWATVLGASVVIRREVFEKIGGFDEDFFLYAEETDLCLRIRKQGFKIGYCDRVTVLHVGSASVRKTPPEQVIRRKKQAKYLFYRKHYCLQDVIQIAKKELQHAKWHWLRLVFKKKIIGLSAHEEYRLLRHKVTCDIASGILQQI